MIAMTLTGDGCRKGLSLEVQLHTDGLGMGGIGDINLDQPRRGSVARGILP